ncbi:MAG: hypothetical protein Q7Q71_15190 [Verrucomicrobiota bacterium JB023]|nr:hypothetical protein [Verrucomicrobiota bacterium JB023]
MMPAPLPPRIVLAAATLAVWLLSFVLGRFLPTDSPESGMAVSVETSSTLPPSFARFTEAPTALSRTMALERQFEGLRTRADFQEAIASLIKWSDKTEKERHLALLFTHWLNTDPEEALQGIRSIPMLRSHPQRIALAFQHWAANNPEQSADLLSAALSSPSDSLSSLLYRDQIDPPIFMLSLFEGLIREDRSLAASTLSKSPPSRIRDHFLDLLIPSWLAHDPEAAFEWTADLSPEKPALRQAAIAGVAARAGLSADPSSGIDWANSLNNSTERTLALTSLTNQWSQRSPSKAYQWASSLPDEDETKFAIMPEVIRRLTITDPGSAADWLNQYEASPRMDASIAAYIRSVSRINPAAAHGSISAITDPSLRRQLQAELESGD